jgi:surface antigen
VANAKTGFCMHMMVMAELDGVLTQKTGEDNDKDARWKRVEGGGRENGSPRAEAAPFNDRFR